MPDLPATWTALCALAVLLGAKHGFDADHLATIDGLTRCNARTNPRLARLCGTLFSLGHGAVVLLVAFGAALFASEWHTPQWLETVGILVSLTFVFGLGFANLHAVLASAPGAIIVPTGFRSRLLGSALVVQRGWAVTIVGALFALSFDTVSLAALFAFAAGRFGGVERTLSVAGLFVVGMLAVDGVNGAWISRLLRRADRTAAIASRAMALGVAAVSFAVGALTVAKLSVPQLDAWAGRFELAFGATVVAVVAAAFIIGMRVAGRPLRARDSAAGD